MNNFIIQNDMLLGKTIGIRQNNYFLNVIIIYTKWTQWKIKISIKFNKTHKAPEDICNIWKHNLKCVLQLKDVDIIDNTKLNSVNWKIKTINKVFTFDSFFHGL